MRPRHFLLSGLMALAGASFMAATLGDLPAAVAQSPELRSAEVRAAFDRWLASQNSGDFKTYEASYASRFYGVKRFGSSKATYDRPKWLADRKLMFVRKMDVNAADVVVSAGEGTAVVSFTQTWASGRFKDVGPKQLVFSLEGGKWRISREEMLSSERVKSEKVAPLAMENFRPVVDEKGPRLILSRGERVSCLKKPLELIDREVGVRCQVADDAVPDSSKSIKGSQWTLYGVNGPVCQATVDGFEQMVRYYPHFGSTQQWSGMDEAKWSDKRVAQDAWQSGNREDRFLMARLTPTSGTCAGALFAQQAGKPALKVFAAKPADSATQAAALAALRKTAGYKAIHKSYLEGYKSGQAVGKPAKHWDEHPESRAVTVVTLGEGNGQVVAVSVKTGVGCGQFYGQLSAVFSQGPAGLTLLSDDAGLGEEFLPKLGADLNGDGRLELFDGDHLVRPVGPVLRAIESFKINSYDCPC